MTNAPPAREPGATLPQRVASWLQGQNEVLRQLLAGAPLAEVLHTIAGSMEDLVEGAIASVLLLDDDGQRLRFGAAPNLPEALSRALDGMTIGPQAGACGTAAFTAGAVVIEDFECDPRGAGYRELSRQFGLRACWSQPVLAADGTVLGTFALYYRKPRRPTPDELRLIAEAGNLAAVAIETTRNRSALAEREARLRLALDAARMGSFEWEIGRDRITWSRWHEELWGFAPGEFGGDFAAFAGRVHSADLPGIEAEVARCIAARAPFVREFRVVWPDGSTHWIAGRGEFDFAADGRALRMRGMVWEISARKSAEARLQESTHQLRLFVQYSPAAIAMFDRDMRYLVASERWCEDFRLGDSDLSGRSHYEIFPDLPERWKAIHRRCLAGAVERCEEDPFARADGCIDWVRWEVRPWRQADGAIGGLIFFSEVITERKQAQLQLQDYSARLELLSRRLLAAQESERRQVARELHDEIGQLLTVVKLDLQTVLQQPGSAALTEALGEGMESIDRVVARVRDLSLDLRPSMLDDLGLLPTLRWFIQRKAQRLGDDVEWRLQLPGDLPRLAGDIETACFRVAQEALTNVARHARASCIEVELNVHDQRLRLIVRDNGAGFAPGAGAEASGQAGFGLLGMQERAELAGGQLRLESAPGRGTCISAEFPATPASKVAP